MWTVHLRIDAQSGSSARTWRLPRRFHLRGGFVGPALLFEADWRPRHVNRTLPVNSALWTSGSRPEWWDRPGWRWRQVFTPINKTSQFPSTRKGHAAKLLLWTHKG